MSNLVKQAALYANHNAKIAPDNHSDFRLCASMGGNHWEVKGEGGWAWAEVHEVGSYFNADDDGAIYYVGDYRLDPILPSLEEIRLILEANSDLCLSEMFALDLVFGV